MLEVNSFVKISEIYMFIYLISKMIMFENNGVNLLISIYIYAHNKLRFIYIFTSFIDLT